MTTIRRFGADWSRCAAAIVGGSTCVSSLVHRLLRDAKERRTLAAQERALDAENEKVEK